MKNFKAVFTITVFLLAFISLFVCYDCVAKGVTSGLYLCADVVIPTLFPTLCVTSFLAQSGVISLFSKRLERVSKKLFNLSGYFIPVFLISMVSGYPVGAAVSNSLYNSAEISLTQRNKLAVISCFAGPSFLVLAIGVGMFGSFEIGVILLVSHILSGISVAIITTRFYKYEDSIPIIEAKKIYFGDSLVKGVSTACSSIIAICAYTVLFSAITNVISLYLKNTVFYLPVVSMLEVTNAVYVLTSENVPLSVVSAALGFGGFSVIFQISSVLGNNRPPISELIIVRLLNAMLSFVFCNICLKFCDITQPVVKTSDTFLKMSSKNFVFSLSLMLLLTVFLYSFKKDMKLGKG